uniref:UDP-glycosyltransferase n=1 Tax=Timema bartmani TaxID=61472 RepID=A0A7R9EMZ8_9NEOP|nr:unnamed protein product [Timema bartmani]
MLFLRDQNLKTFLDGAKNGAILFALGTNVRSDQLPPETRKSLLDAFSELPQRILWKFETEDLPGKPDNVMISKWLPQSDVLELHRNKNRDINMEHLVYIQTLVVEENIWKEVMQGRIRREQLGKSAHDLKHWLGLNLSFVHDTLSFVVSPRHPNVKLFITHCGLYSTQEAIYFGVPVVGIPFFMDQHSNFYRLKELGVGEGLVFSSLTKDKILNTINAVIKNSRYTLSEARRTTRREFFFSRQRNLCVSKWKPAYWGDARIGEERSRRERSLGSVTHVLTF